MRSWVVAVALVLSAPSAHAQARSDVRRLRYDPVADNVVTWTGLALLVTSEVLKPHLVPTKCRWCSRRNDGSSALNRVDQGVRARLLWQNPRTADTLSSMLAFGVLPATSFGLTTLAAAHDQAPAAMPVDMLLVAQATVLALDFNQLNKFAFARQRPFVHALPRAPDELRELTASPSDDNLSFFSGHTTLAFAMATASGTVSSLRGYRLAPLVWGTGLASATAVGYLRIAADKHYFSDVLVGIVVGSLFGAGIPLLFHRPAGNNERTDEPAVPAGTTAPSRAAAAPPMFSFGGTW